jgi:hypothetical protein
MASGFYESFWLKPINPSLKIAIYDESAIRVFPLKRLERRGLGSKQFSVASMRLKTI